MYWVCHGNGFDESWTQVTNNASSNLMTHAIGVGYNHGKTHFATMVVYVRIDNTLGDGYKLDYLCLIGGQMHIHCSCTYFLLIVLGQF